LEIPKRPGKYPQGVGEGENLIYFFEEDSVWGGGDTRWMGEDQKFITLGVEEKNDIHSYPGGKKISK